MIITLLLLSPATIISTTWRTSFQKSTLLEVLTWLAFSVVTVLLLPPPVLLALLLPELLLLVLSTCPELTRVSV